MQTDLAVICLLVLILVALAVIGYRVTHMPVRLWSIARAELGRAHEDEEAKAERALHVAADRRAAVLLASIRTYSEDIAGVYRQQVADANARVQPLERQAAETAMTLETATTLVRDLRGTLDELRPLVDELRALASRSEEGPLKVPERLPPPVPRSAIPPPPPTPPETKRGGTT